MAREFYEIFVDNQFQEAWEFEFDAVRRAEVIAKELGSERVKMEKCLYVGNFQDL